ncbi:unnamed protein product [Caenorhabditis auriculariae]|uniref:TRPM SLOG domain-containing protein n=1 Tax=Caenorhabditis auriculariae TaxID=2777116 RepID=A0A8S1HML3_9PELO|nr:unnamed protein product [Caenorhabditis auriculariae]
MDRRRGSLVPSIHKAVEDNLKANHVTIEAKDNSRKKRRRKVRSNSVDASAPLASAPRHVHGFDWKDMLHLADIGPRKRGNSASSHSGHATRASSLKGSNWIEARLKIRQCCQFVPQKFGSDRCGCGKSKTQHHEEISNQPIATRLHLTLPGIQEVVSTDNDSDTQNSGPGRWSIKDHTELHPTDTYGTIIFEGTTHHVQFARMTFDTDPKDIAHLLFKVWKLRPPKLIITIHGGLTKFDLQPKLARTFRKGIMKIAKSTDAWILTSGLDEGVVKHVATALEDHGSHHTKNHVVAMGIASWGMLKKRGRFVGKGHTVTYAPNMYNNTRLKELNDRHSYFLFADNGTVNRYGAEIIMRKRLETYLAQGDKKRSAIPLICVVLEGGAFTIKMVHDYVITIPRIPVIVCDGSGRAADILAFAHQTVAEDGYLSESVRGQMTSIVKKIFGYDVKMSQKLIKQIIECTRQKHLMTIFRLGESQREDLDHAIMSCLLKGQNLSPPEQLQLALAWNRADIARSEIFANGTEWTTQDLHNAMIEALCNDRIDFVQLLLENGVSMQKFLTYGRLEHLYNTDKGPQNTLRSNLFVDSKHHIRLMEVGRLIEDLMGNLYKSNYTKDEFKNQYYLFNNRRHFGKRDKDDESDLRGEVFGQSNGPGRDRMNSMQINLLNSARHSIISIFGGKQSRNSDDEDDDGFSNIEEENNVDFTFRFPYSELMIWAVLTKRHSMAMLMWKHGEEAMAKALVASRLCMSLASSASLTTGEIGMSQEFSDYSGEFADLAVEVLEYCTKHSRDTTLQLLTCELSNWGGETCLSLAATSEHRPFLAHPCCQMLLSDLWQGGLLMKTNQNAQVLGCLLVPPLIFMLGFKTKEQLMLQPQTALEHDEDWESDASSVDGLSDSSDSSSDEDEEKEEKKRTVSLSEQPLSIQKLVRDKFRISEKKNKVSVLKGIVVAPTMVNGRNRSRTMSIKKGKKSLTNSVAPVLAAPAARITVDETDDDADAARYINRTSKRPSIMNHSDLYADEPEDREESVPTRTPMPSEEMVSGQPGVHILTQRPLSWKKKLFEFYKAPITTYWLWFFAFTVFICMLAYNLLIKTQKYPSWSEWFVFCYVVVWGLEMLRKVVSIIMMDETKPILKQLRVFFFSYRNGTLSFALATFIIAFFIRLHPATRMLGRIFLIVNSVMWSLKLIDYLSVQPSLGPYIQMTAEMIPQMMPLVVMVFVTLFAFGLIRQSITFPYEDWHWILLRNIFLQPYFMLYGEVYAAQIDTCGDEIWDTHEDQNIPINQLNVTHETCVPGYFIAPIFLTLFMLATNVLLMNVMVACCTYVFEKRIMMTREMFLFDRYQQVMEYESTPWIPPPFTIIYHILWVIRWIRVRNRMFQRRNLFDASLKLFLSPEEMERVHAFEEESVEDMKREKEKLNQSSNEERIHRTAERTDVILHRVNNLTTMEISTRDELRELESKMKTIEAKHKEEMTMLLEMNRKLTLLLGGGKRGSLGGGGSEDLSPKPSTAMMAPLITFETATPSSSLPNSRRTSVQSYKKRDSLQKRRSSSTTSDKVVAGIRVPVIHLDLIEPESPHIVVTESEREMDSDGEFLDNESRAGVSPLPPPMNRRHALYTTIADHIDSGSDFYADAPSPVISTPLPFENEPSFEESDNQAPENEEDDDSGDE